MKTELYTIPHTGTGFVGRFFKLQGIPYHQRHVAAPREVPVWRWVLTVRNPYDCYLTHRRQFPSNTDANFVAMWGHYLWRTQWMDAFYVALDAEDRHRMMRELVMWCGETPDQEIINPFCDEWQKVRSTRVEGEQVPDHMIKPLAFAHEWYRFYTEHWGKHIRDSQNMNGEGP